MCQFQEPGLRQLLAQLLDDAQADAAAAMDGLARGLVDDQQGIVPIDHPVQQGTADSAGSGGFRLFRDPHRRDAHLVIRLQFVIGLGPMPGNPHLPFPQHAVDAAFRHPLEAAEQEIVQALAGLFLANLDFCYSSFAGWFHYRILAMLKKRAIRGVEDPARAPTMSAGCLRSPAKVARPVFSPYDGSRPMPNPASIRIPEARVPKKAAMVTQFICATRTRILARPVRRREER
jgi:hypothetical protein